MKAVYIETQGRRETPSDGETLLDLILGESFAVPINVSAVNI